MPYDPIKDFAPITLVAASPNVIIGNPSVPAKSMKELVELIKANPGKYSYAQPGTGTTPHLAGELFKLKFSLDLTTVPFTGAAPAINSTLGGHTPVAFTALPPAIANVQEGKLRGLAVIAAKRSPALPDVPTMAEAGVPDQESDTLTGIVAPAGTPKEIIDRWRIEIAKAVADARGQAAAGDARLRAGRQYAGRIRRADQEPRWRSGARSCATPKSARTNEYVVRTRKRSQINVAPM